MPALKLYLERNGLEFQVEVEYDIIDRHHGRPAYAEYTSCVRAGQAHTVANQIELTDHEVDRVEMLCTQDIPNYEADAAEDLEGTLADIKFGLWRQEQLDSGVL